MSDRGKATRSPGSRRTRRDRSTNPDRLLALLGIPANDVALFQTALTHRSAAGQPWANADTPSRDSNERLEYLGDAVLGTIVAEDLYHRFPDDPEGLLTRTRSAVVRTEQLAAWAEDLDLGSFLYLAPGERNSSSGRERILAGAFEALIGAIYLDRGLEAVKTFVGHRLERDVDQILVQATESNPKGRLQEITQELFQRAPVYETVEIEGPPHERHFTVEVRFDHRLLGTGTGGSKRAAEEAAAGAALTLIDDEGEQILRTNTAGEPDVGE